MDDFAPSSAWRFDRFVLDLANGGLFRVVDSGAREPVAVGSRALEVLAALVTRSGELIAKQTIMDAVWPGVSVEEKNLTVQISALRRVLDRDRGEESYIQTVPGRGYRFTCPAERLFITEPQTFVAPTMHPAVAPPRRFNQRLVSTAGLLVVLILSAGFWLGRDKSSSRPVTPPRLSVTVVPFANLGSDTQDDRVAHWIADGVTNWLLRYPEVILLAPPSGRTAATAAAPPPATRARYVIEGSVRRAGAVLRVNVKLTATETGETLRSETTEQSVDTDSDGETDIIARVSRALLVPLFDTETAQNQRERPTNPDVNDLLVKARALSLHGMSVQERTQRIALFEQAIALEPTSVNALTQLADELIKRFELYYGDADTLDRAEALLRVAATVNPNDMLLLANTAHLLLARGKVHASAAAYRRMIAEYPDISMGYNELAINLNMLGQTEEAVSLLQTAIRLDPRNPNIRASYGNLGVALMMMERDEEAIVWTQRSLAGNPAERVILRAQMNIRLAASHARLGQFDVARKDLDEANRIWPHDTVRMHWPDDLDSPANVAQIERYVAALRLAGHRDHADEKADFGVAADDVLHDNLAGFTPTSVPGATVIHTAELERLIAEHKPVMMDTLLYSWGRSIPGAVGLKFAGMGGTLSDRAQDRLRRKMRQLTQNDLAAPVVAIGFNSERFDGRNLALRLAALGYTDIRWYRGGREAWEAAGLPETAMMPEDW